MGYGCCFCCRYEVTQLLLRLWARPDCRQSIITVCGKKKFQVCGGGEGGRGEGERREGGGREGGGRGREGRERGGGREHVCIYLLHLHTFR